MTTRRYEKLVRDRIPEIIAGNGQRCVCETLSDARYLEMLDAKLDEELADLLEVIRAVAQARGSSIKAVEALRAAKAEARGGFAGKIFLHEVSDPD